MKDMPDNIPIDSILAELPENEDGNTIDVTTAVPRKSRDLPHMMRKIPVTLTLEVGSAQVSLQELVAIEANSVIELDTLAGEPLVIKVNGTPIGRAEVVLTGDNYGLRVVEISSLDFDNLQ